MDLKENIGIYGFGYVGATLACALVREGYPVTCFEINEEKIRYFSEKRKMNFFEPHVDQVLGSHFGTKFTLEVSSKPETLTTAILTVSTPVDPMTHIPNLDYVDQAFKDALKGLKRGGLLVIRSTCPVGTTKKLKELYRDQIKEKQISVAFCPERTIQGQAVREIEELPQVIGSESEHDLRVAESFWNGVAKESVVVSSTEAAELVKLANNCHTDVIYGYGNQIALVAQEFGIDPYEVIEACNFNYPRPNLHRPGYVGGACLIKDPYILLSSVSESTRNHLKIVSGARHSNEEFSRVIAEKVRDALKSRFQKPGRILICGVAYKGVPETDDLRGAPIYDFIEILKVAGFELLGHDFIVTPETTRSLGITPFEEPGNLQAILLLNNHPKYKEWPLFSNHKNLDGSETLIFDSWSILNREAFLERSHIKYMNIGFL